MDFKKKKKGGPLGGPLGVLDRVTHAVAGRGMDGEAFSLDIRFAFGMVYSGCGGSAKHSTRYIYGT